MNKALKVMFIVFISIFATIISLGIIFVSVFGFNGNIQLTGGEKITISVTNSGTQDEKEFNDEFVLKQNELISKAKSALARFGKVNVESEILGEGLDQVIVLKYKDSNISAGEIASENDKIVEEIEGSIKDVSKLNLTVSAPVKITNSIWINWGIESLAVCVLIFLVFTYFMVRFFSTGALSVLIGMVIGGFSFLGVIAFSRIEVTSLLACGVGLIVVLNAISQVFILNNVKKQYVEKSSNQSGSLIWNAVKSNLFEVISIHALVLIIGIIILFFNLSFGLYFVVSSIISCLINLFIIPGFLELFTAKNGVKIKFNNLNK